MVMRIMKFLDYSSEVVVNGKKLITFNPNKSHRKELSERANCALVLAENKYVLYVVICCASNKCNAYIRALYQCTY